jgi:glycosyltransferase involved in cell wall biosynthesis
MFRNLPEATANKSRVRGHSMKISGFSFARNTDKLGYPLEASFRSVLPLCDELIVAVGKGDEDDRTRSIIESIDSPKIKIVDTLWTDREKLRGKIYSQQTNIALRECSGDWCLYIQADEVLHEKYLDSIYGQCGRFLDDAKVEGLLFAYRHFWGDYDHYQNGHKWYPYEIRMIRNGLNIESIGDAQSFRKNNQKLHVAKAHATMYHYGYVRNPALMQQRNVETLTTYWGETKVKEVVTQPVYDFGSLAKLPVFKETHPAILQQRIAEMNWKHLLQYTGKSTTHFKHDRLKYRILSWMEKHLFGGRQIGGYKNYILLTAKKYR